MVIFLLEALPAFLVFEDGQRQLLHITKVHYILPQLVFIKGILGTLHKLSQTLQLPLDHKQFILRLFLIQRKSLGLILYNFLDFVPDIGKAFFPILLLIGQTSACFRLFKADGCKRPCQYPRV